MVQQAKMRAVRLFAVVLSVVMVLVMCVGTAFADDPGTTSTGSITINNATIDKGYALYKVFDATYNGDNTSYTYTSDGEVDGLYDALEANDSPFSLTETVVNGTYNVALKSDKTPADVANWLKEKVDLLDKIGDSITATSSVVEFNNLDFGYYYITSSLGAAVTITSAVPSATVLDKNQDGGSGFIKTVDAENTVVEIGEVFDFTLSFTATNHDGETKIVNYVIKDTLPEGMELVGNSATVKIGDETPSVVNIVPESEDPNSFTITLPWQNEDEFLYSSPVDVTVTYEVVLTDDAPIQQGITNTAELDWTGNAGEKPEDTETVYTYALAIMKVDDKGTALSNATFAVTDSSGEAVNVASIVGEPGVYVVDSGSSSNEVVSPDTGLIVIKGVDDIEYVLTETEAPDGYNLLNAPVHITPTSTGSKTITIHYDEHGNVVESEGSTNGSVVASVPVTAKVVVNETGSTLPSTGGIGTTIFYIVGGVLVAGAVVLFVTKRRMNANK